MGAEWRAIGLRGMYGYMADLATEPRWYRVHETFSEDSGLTTAIVRTLVESLQGGPLSPRSDVALTIKHFPGGGPQLRGLAQIAMDGSQKIPQRWLPTLAAAQRRGARCPAILEALAAWLLHLRDGGDLVSDPAAAALRQAWSEHGQEGIVRALFGVGGRFSATWVATPQDAVEIGRAIVRRPG